MRIQHLFAARLVALIERRVASVKSLPE